MAKYHFSSGTLINGIDYGHIQFLLTVQGNKIRLRDQGAAVPFLECDFEDLTQATEGGTVPFDDVADFIDYFNANFGTTQPG